MVILLKGDKSLQINSSNTIMQGENLVDKLKIYVPLLYEDSDMSLFSATLFYKDSGNNVYSEVLTSTESDKENYLEFVLPVTTAITDIAGKVEIWLEFTYTDTNNSSVLEKQILRSKSAAFDVKPWDNYELATSVSTKLDAMQNTIKDLETKIDILTKLVTVISA
ncbi:MAG: hypothetical protein J6Y86_08165 [Pseudobutyrivibrio sp.]|nr:hypothetical protein [Pseudobutyrivibrio sp.]